jgi:hypothetical protein
MSLHRNIKTRLHVFEEEFASAIVDTMYLTENVVTSTFGWNFIFIFFRILIDKIKFLLFLENLRIWNNLVNQLVNLNQIIHLPALIQLLYNKVCF